MALSRNVKTASISSLSLQFLPKNMLKRCISRGSIFNKLLHFLPRMNKNCKFLDISRITVPFNRNFSFLTKVVAQNWIQNMNLPKVWQLLRSFKMTMFQNFLSIFESNLERGKHRAVLKTNMYPRNWKSNVPRSQALSKSNEWTIGFSQGSF